MQLVIVRNEVTEKCIMKLNKIDEEEVILFRHM